MSNKTEIVEGELEDEGREVTTGALVAMNSAEINQQIMTAKAYPRDITTFRKKVLTFASMDEQVAQSCMYALKRKNADGTEKLIEGPSARFAEIVAQTWGNCRAGARVVEVGETHITAQGFFYDLENNVAVSFEVMRPIVGKKTDYYPNGKRFSNDMISVTGNAACSIALRNAVFKGVPKAYWNHGYLAARATVAGTLDTIVERRTNMLKAFQNDFGVKPEQVYALIGVKGAPDISLDHMVFLGGLHNTIKEGETTVERAFNPENFANNGTMTPSAPERSHFTREDEKSSDDKEKSEASKKTPDNGDNAAQTKPAGETAVRNDEETVTQESASTSVANEDLSIARAEFLEDMKKDAITKAQTEGIKALTDFRDDVLKDLTDDQAKTWIDFIEKLTKETLDAKRSTTKKRS